MSSLDDLGNGRWCREGLSTAWTSGLSRPTESEVGSSEGRRRGDTTVMPPEASSLKGLEDPGPHTGESSTPVPQCGYSHPFCTLTCSQQLRLHHGRSPLRHFCAPITPLSPCLRIGCPRLSPPSIPRPTQGAVSRFSVFRRGRQQKHVTGRHHRISRFLGPSGAGIRPPLIISPLPWTSL